MKKSKIIKSTEISQSAVKQIREILKPLSKKRAYKTIVKLRDETGIALRRYNQKNKN